MTPRAVTMVALAGLAAAQTLTKVILPSELVNNLGARCMDGSAGGYYYSKGTAESAGMFVVFIQGGGECRTRTDCEQWYTDHASNSSRWAPTMRSQPATEMDPDCTANPDFCNWTKVYIPYCTGDMHSGTKLEPSSTLGGFYFSGHLQIAGVVADLKAKAAVSVLPTPTHVLVTGSSAGGIGALMHTDFFGEEYPTAVVKGIPNCGFFYAGVTAANDRQAGRPTPAEHLGFIADWKPWLPTACAKATDGNMSRCTDAHYLYPYLVKPLFIRENQYDTAKLANCGWDGVDTAYIKAWGQWMRAQLAVIAKSEKDGFFSGSCLEHGGNFGFDTSPVINGVRMRDAVSNWFFEKGNATMQYTLDDCSVTEGTGLPCTAVEASSRQSCPHLASPGPPGPPLSPGCLSQLGVDCPGLRGEGETCGACVREHAADLKAKGCPRQYEPVYAGYCAPHNVEGWGPVRSGAGQGHHVCDLSLGARRSVFGGDAKTRA